MYLDIATRIMSRWCVLADRGVERRVAEPAFISETWLRQAHPLGNELELGPQAVVERRNPALASLRLKSSFFWLPVVPIFISYQERGMYSWMPA